MSTEIKIKHNHNIEHDVTNCSFLTAKCVKCGSFAEFLSYLEHPMIDAPEFLNDFNDSRFKS